MHTSLTTSTRELAPLSLELARAVTEKALGVRAPIAQQEFLVALMLAENSTDTLWVLNELLNPQWTVAKLATSIASSDNLIARQYGNRYLHSSERDVLELVWQVSARLYQGRFGLKKPD
ncbi:hypothetical protein [Caballeronia sordidicola]|uniref:hypothetical protein n=1 Tax=Caballeronia sordidicola TaxID=196367 RepID=UPI00094D4A2F|nr:hypothetical protein [Caballeronia sordidicola]